MTSFLLVGRGISFSPIDLLHGDLQWAEDHIPEHASHIDEIAYLMRYLQHIAGSQRTKVNVLNQLTMSVFTTFKDRRGKIAWT